MSKVRVCICPYCGETQPADDKCRACGGLFDAESRQATLNAMGPWFVRNELRPFHPGRSYEIMARMVEQGRLTKYTIIRGPTTRQFWQIARRVPGIAHLLGYCHHCDAQVHPKDLNCPNCHAAFGAYLDRNHLGLPEVTPMGWESDDAGASTAEFRQSFEEPRPQATGISSFARDEDLLDQRDRIKGVHDETHETRTTHGHPGAVFGHDVEHTPDAESVERRSTSTALADDAGIARLASAAPEADSYAMLARQRSLERRLRQQKNVARVFIIMFFVAVLLGIAMQLEVFGDGGSGDDGAVVAPGGTQETSGNGEDVASTKGNAAQGAQDSSVGDDSITTPPTLDGVEEARDDTADTSGDAHQGAPGQATDQTTNGSDDATDGGDDDRQARGDDAETQTTENAAVRGEFARAQNLAKTAGDMARPIDDRLADLREAIAILKNIRDQFPRSAWPIADLELRIAELDRLMKRMEIEAKIGG